MIRRVAFLLCLALVFMHPAPTDAYLKFGFRIGDRTVDVKWPQQPIRYFVNERDVPGVTAGDFRAAIGRAAATWQAVEGSTVALEFLGTTGAPPGMIDGRTTLGFLDRPDLDRVLGATSFILDSSTGAIVESDIFFNTAFPWSVAPQGEPGRVDVESVVLHELGHLIGLGHSAIGETEPTGNGARRVLGSGAVMFPIAMTAGAVADRVLQADDMAGAADLYPQGNQLAETGSLRGRVTKQGSGVFGAHVTAFNPATGTLVGGFTLNEDGTFVIAGLTPGPHIIRVEPLDDGDVESFLGGEGDVDVDFRAGYAPRMLVAPRGGTSEEIEIPVVAK
jgi:hypothetical protein